MNDNNNLTPEIHSATASVSNAPLTTAVTEQLSPALLRSEIDRRIVKIRPASTPIDQISRMCGARHAGSMKVDFYSVNMNPGEVTLGKDIPQQDITAGTTIETRVDKSGVLSASETVMFPTVNVGEAGNEKPLICYVKKVEGMMTELIPVGTATIPAIAKGTRIVRMGRAADELDVQTPQYTALPTKRFNYCQIFKAQVEESMYQRLSDKEVGWTFSDQEEVAVLDMRLGMEKSFLFGERSRLDTGDGSEVYLTGGIWNQAGKTHDIDLQAFKENDMLDLMRKAFTGGTGSRRKILVGGTDLIDAIGKLDYKRVVSAREKETVWGVDFDKIVSKFGSLYVIHSEIFDLCGMPGNGMVIDPDYMTKYSHVPFRAERISFAKQGVRNTEAVVLTESSCLVLRYPETHMRVIANK